MVRDDEYSQQKHPEFLEDGVNVPLEKINSDTLKKLITEFVTREWEEVGDAAYTLEDKINQVLSQLNEGKAKIVFDLRTETCNIVTMHGNPPGNER